MCARRGLGWLLGCLLVPGCAPVPPSSRIELPVRQFSVADVQLPSGLRVILEDDPSARVVTSALVVSAGAAEDPPGQEGLAHLVEHLTFRAHHPGQPNLTSWFALHGIGSWNGATTPDLTNYYEVGPPETLAWMIDAEVARMSAPLEGIDEAIFDAERGVVLAELRQRDESGHYQELWRTIASQLFPASHPYSRWVGGTPESLAHLTLAQAQAWTAEHYRPRNVTWVLGGALDPQKTAAILDKRVPAVLRAPDPQGAPAPRRQAITEPEPPAPATLPIVNAPVSRPTLVVAWRLPPAEGENEYVYSVLPAMLGVGWFDSQDIESQDASLGRFDAASVLYLELELKPEADPEEVWKTVRKLWTLDRWGGGTLTSQARVENLFGQVRGASVVDLARRTESPVTRAVLRATRARFSGQATTLTAQNTAIAKLTYASVLSAGGAYVTSDRARAVLLKPVGGHDETGPDASAEGPAAFAPEAGRAEYPTEAVARFVQGPHLSGVTGFTASNGLEVLAIPDPGSGLVTVALGIRGGRLTSSPPGLADRLRWAHQNYAYHRPSYMGASVESDWSDDSGLLVYRGASGNLSNLLAMLAERLLTRRTSDPPKFELSRKSMTPEADVFHRRFWQALLGEPGSQASRPLAEVAALSGGAAQDWIDQVLNPHSSVLVVSGEIKGSLQEEVDHWLGRWHGPEKFLPSAVPPLPPPPGHLRVLKATLPQAKQLRVRFGCTVTGRTLEDELALTMLGSELARQWRVIERETKGASYGFQSDVGVRRDGTMRLVVTGRVEAGTSRRMALAVSQAWKGLPGLASNETTLNRLRWEYGRAYNVRFLVDETVGRDVAHHRLLGRPADAVDAVPGALMRASPATMASIGKQCHDSAVLGLMGPASALDVDLQLPADAQVL